MDIRGAGMFNHRRDKKKKERGVIKSRRRLPSFFLLSFFSLFGAFKIRQVPLPQSASLLPNAYLQATCRLS